MKRDIVIAALLLAAGFLLGIVYSRLVPPPTQMDVAIAAAESILDAAPETEVEAVEETGTGPVIYVGLRRTRPQADYVPIARIEIGYGGRMLPSFWKPGETFYEPHRNRSMDEDQVIVIIRSIAAAKRANQS